jgi:3-oxoacyl-[acyl-carrier-protein] synthase II
MRRRRVVVTGMGVISPVGDTLTEIWQRAAFGEPNVTFIERFDTSGFGTHIACQVEYDLARYFRDLRTVKEIRRGSNRMADFTCIAALQALQDANLLAENQKIMERYRDHVFMGIATGGGAAEVISEGAALIYSLRKEYPHDPDRVAKEYAKKRVFAAIQMLPDSGNTRASIALGARNGFVTTVQACASGAGSILAAWEKIVLGRADICVAGGADAIEETSFLDFSVLARSGAMTKQTTNINQASRPFDRNRDGFVMSEGAACLVLEELEHALQRHAVIYGEVLDGAMKSDAKHDTDPDPVQQAATIQLALRNAGVHNQDIAYINLHGTSTPNGDIAETRAVKNAFGDFAYTIATSSTKWLTGHMMGATGAMEAIYCLLALQTGIIPPTKNLQTPDPECDLDYTPNVPREADMSGLHALNLSFGFGGQDVVLCFKKFSL